MQSLSSTSLSSILLSNRILRSATHEGLADESGRPEETLIRKYEQLARGGVGAIITGYAGVSQEGKSPLFNMLMINHDSLIPSYVTLVERIHRLNTPIILQIAHCGRQTRSRITGVPTVAPSSVRDRLYLEDLPHELSAQEIHGLVDKFVSAITRAVKAGFDGVQLHMAHGYLLSQFLSNHSNKRKDLWGGSLENRFRIVQEIFRKARLLHPDYPILAKINATDGRKKGMRIEESIQIARMLQESGCDAIEVSCGTFEDGFMTIRGKSFPMNAILEGHFLFRKLPLLIRRTLRPVVPLLLPRTPEPYLNYNVEDAARIRKNVQIPIIVVGGIRKLDDIEKMILNEQCDMVALSRPLIREPGLVRKFQEGKSGEATCSSCNYCTILQESRSLRCYNGTLPATKRSPVLQQDA